MMNAELIDALQCTSHFALYQDCYKKNCYANRGKGYCNIPKLMADAADALEAADKRIAELMPKEGEWIIDGMNEYQLSYGCVGYEPIYRCSKCGITTESYLRTEKPIMPEDADFPNYCQNCGAKMMKGDK